MAEATVAVTVAAAPAAPTGGCPQPSNCKPCQACGSAPDPVMPRCDVVLADGVFTNATIVVENGCIIEVQGGEPEVYDPDSCCATPGSGGSGGPGPQGPPGPTGQSATVAVGTVGTTAPGTPATVTNVGSPVNAVFNFTIPRGEPGEDGDSPTGLTINAAGIEFVNGSLQSVPVQWPPLMIGTGAPVDVPGVVLTAVKDDGTGNLTITLSMATYDLALRAAVTAEIGAAMTVLQDQIDTQAAQIADLLARVATIESTCCGP